MNEKQELSREARFAEDIIGVINELFDDESPNKRYDLHEIDLTAFFTGLVLANNVLVNRVTGNENDVLDTLSQNTRLFMQYAERLKLEESDNKKG